VTRAVHQFLPTFAGADAIGQHCLRLRKLLREAGWDSHIYARDMHDDVRGEGRNARDYRPAPGDWALYHFSVGNPLADDLVALGVPLGVDYHNITEARYFLRWEPVVASILYEGRRQLATMAPAARFALADSTFNEQEVIELGFAPTAVAPILIDFADYDREPNAAVVERRVRRREQGGADWLCVSRLAPNKCQHDVIAAFAIYQKLFDPQARLTLVGGQSAIRYSNALKRMCTQLGVARAVTFPDVIPHDELLAYYRTSDVFVHLSEHEGFNVGVLEAMYFDVPVVAYSCCAVPETVGDGGLLLDDKDPLLVASAVSELLGDSTARKRLTVAGRERVDHFGLERTGPVMLDALTTMIEQAS
jgi:glycosyltransferase involved in cell wall biosynthesis